MIAIAIDDEPPALSIIEKFCSEINDVISLKKTFTNPVEAIKYMKKFPVDLLLIDIQMPGFNGMEIYKSMTNKPLVIFTTAYSEYAVDGFNVNAVDYLLKPFTLDRFTQAVQKAFDQFKNSRPLEQNKYISIRSNYSLTKILIDEIILIESFDDYLNVCLSSGKKYIVRMTMKKIMEQLPANTFVRVHRSFIVPINKIENVRNKVITLVGHKIPIGSKYEKEFFSVFRDDI
jgi:DNA-binding LytR/AlgR family response regulator